MINKNQKGFTLTELLVVIAIIGILLILVMVNFSRGNRSTELRQAGNNLMQDFRKTQSYSISGNSVRYCDEISTDYKYNPCDLDTYCQNPDGAQGACILSVPGGGYGISIQSRDNYSIYADTYFVDGSVPESPVAHNYFDGTGIDYEITNRNYTLDGIHISEYKLGDNPTVAPNSTVNRLDIVFSVPEGKANFYLNFVEALDTMGQPINNLQILISSDYVSGSCRKISINRISGQISESQSGCNL
ncbi:MAG: prepilin-type N-terminal cleavage/methylation domain-containing protein [bacterium]|nr:prepilin-type N-terminal cleavage/methylation domain-containing protein [bacterium]